MRFLQVVAPCVVIRPNSMFLRRYPLLRIHSVTTHRTVIRRLNRNRMKRRVGHGMLSFGHTRHLSINVYMSKSTDFQCRLHKILYISAQNVSLRKTAGQSHLLARHTVTVLVSDVPSSTLAATACDRMVM